MAGLRRPGSRSRWRRAAGLAVGLGLLGACAGATRIELPAELPLRTLDQIFQIRWALQQQPTVARAIGQIEYAVDNEYRITLAFYGLDAERRILSRGVAYLQSSLSYEPIPFVVELTPTGREASFELRIVHYRTAVPPRT